jgi:hypothetical protein
MSTPTNVMMGTCYTGSECTSLGGTASGNCASGKTANWGQCYHLYFRRVFLKKWSFIETMMHFCKHEEHFELKRQLCAIFFLENTLKVKTSVPKLSEIRYGCCHSKNAKDFVILICRKPTVRYFAVTCVCISPFLVIK